MKRALILILLLLCVPISAQTAPDSTFTESLRIGRGAVQHAGWHPDGERILIDTVRGAWLYGVGDGRLTDITHLPDVRLARFSADGTRIAGIDAEQNLTLFDAETYEQRATLPGHIGYVHELAWGAGDERIATLDHTGRLIVWDVQAQALAFEPDFDETINFAWNPSGNYLATVDGGTGNPYVWDADGEIVFSKTLVPTFRYGAGLVWRTDTELTQYYSGEVPGGVLWDLNDPSAENDLLRLGYGFAYSSDGSKYVEGRVVEWSADDTFIGVSYWNTRKLLIVNSSSDEVVFERTMDFSVWLAAWHPQQNTILVVDSASQIHFFRVDRELNRFTLHTTHAEIGTVAAWHGEGDVIAIADTTSGGMICDANTGEVIGNTVSTGYPLTDFVWQPGGTYLAAYARNSRDETRNNIFIWEWDRDGDDVSLLIVIPLAFGVSDVAWRGDGNVLASAESQSYIRLWEPDNPDTLRRLSIGSFGDGAERLAGTGWSTNGDTIHVSYHSAGNGGGIRHIDVESGEASINDIPQIIGSTWVWTPNNRFLWANWMTFGSGGPLPTITDIAVGGDGITDDGQPAIQFSGLNEQVISGQFSPDTRLILGYDVDHNAIIWDVATQAIISEFDNVNGAVWSPDSTMVAVYEPDGVIRIVDARSGETVDTLDNHFQFNAYDNQNSRRAQVIWSPDSQRIAVLDSGVLFIYDQPI